MKVECHAQSEYRMNVILCEILFVTKVAQVQHVFYVIIKQENCQDIIRHSRPRPYVNHQ